MTYYSRDDLVRFHETRSRDLFVVDETHRLRNVYKPENKTARTLRDALAHARKVFLTATPLQNTLLELYGLVSFIDDRVFGDLDSFRQQFAQLRDAAGYDALAFLSCPRALISATASWKLSDARDPGRIRHALRGELFCGVAFRGLSIAWELP